MHGHHKCVERHPYPIDTLFMFMANMSNSSMNTSGVIDMLTDRDAETGDYKIPSSSIRMRTGRKCPMPTSCCRIPPIWNAGIISLLDRPICSADGLGRRDRQPVVQPDRDVRAFQSVMLDLGARFARRA